MRSACFGRQRGCRGQERSRQDEEGKGWVLATNGFLSVLEGWLSLSAVYRQFVQANRAGSRDHPLPIQKRVAERRRSGTGAPGSPGRTPDFLSSLPASALFMRLSLMKAAHAYVGEAPCRKSGYLGRKRWGYALGVAPTIAFSDSMQFGSWLAKAFNRIHSLQL